MSKQLARQKQKKIEQRKALVKRGTILVLALAAGVGWAAVLMVR